MLRLPPTSISLSEKDIEFHLRQAELYHGLRKQGFSKQDIIRYIDDYRELTTQNTSQEDAHHNLNAPSTFELALRRPLSLSECTGSDRPTEPQRQSSLTDTASSSTTPFPDLNEDPDDYKCAGGGKSRATSPVSMAPSKHVTQHAPRKSSLLRFAEVASPERHRTNSATTPANTAPMTATKVKVYKRRSVTYPYESSGRDSTGEYHIQDNVVDELQAMSLQDGATDDESEDSTCALPLATSFNTNMSDAIDRQFASPASAGDSPDSMGMPLAFSPTIPYRSSSLLGHTSTTEEIPSSPPLPRTPPRQSVSRPWASSVSPQLPITPTPIRNAGYATQTPPRRIRHQMDGNSFTIYNDSMPASSQAQTPAHLSRQPMINEHNVAYTAPPGIITSMGASQYGRRAWELDPGEQSPTARAETLRARRSRELTRSARAERVRLDRLMLRDEAMFTQRAHQRDPAANGGTLPQIQDDIWRDELDVDRVGDENFETDLEAGRQRVTRAVSGNARFDV